MTKYGRGKCKHGWPHEICAHCWPMKAKMVKLEVKTMPAYPTFEQFCDFLGFRLTTVQRHMVQAIDKNQPVFIIKGRGGMLKNFHELYLEYAKQHLKGPIHDVKHNS